MKINVLCAIAIVIAIKAQNEDKSLVNVIPTTPNTIFIPHGKIVNQFTFANIKIHINVTTLFNEVNELCKISKQLDKETKRFDRDNKTKKLIHMLTEDLVTSCKNSMLKLKEITKTFGFNKHHIQLIEQTLTNSREKRQIVIGIIALCSIISIYSVSQLTSLATSSDDELITTSNHIIDAIESHQNKITRSEEDIKRLMSHITLLQKDLYVMNDIQMTLARIFSIKTQAMEIKNHIESVEIGLYSLIKGTLTPHLVNLEALQQSLDVLQQTVIKHGYQVSTAEVSEALQMRCSFVAFTNGKIVALLHIPIYKIQSSLYLYEYISAPLVTNENSTLIIKPPMKYIAFSNKQELYFELSETELNHVCKYIKSTYYCEENAILKKATKPSCLQALYRNEISNIADVCPIAIYKNNEFVTQLNATTFLVYSSTKTQLFITCVNAAGVKVFEKAYQVINFNYVSIFYTCDIALKGHIISTGIPLTVDVSTQIRAINVNMADLIKIGRAEIKSFVTFISKTLTPEARPIHLISAKKQFDLHVLSKNRSIFNKIITTISGILGAIVSLIVLVSLTKLIIKIVNKKKEKYPHINIQLQNLPDFENPEPQEVNNHMPILPDIQEAQEVPFVEVVG